MTEASSINMYLIIIIIINNSAPAVWGGIRVEKSKTNSQANADGCSRRAEQTNICSQASGQKSRHECFKKL